MDASYRFVRYTNLGKYYTIQTAKRPCHKQCRTSITYNSVLEKNQRFSENFRKHYIYISKYSFKTLIDRNLIGEGI